MKINEQIDEILNFFKEDCSYCAITGTIFKDDIDFNIYKKEDVEEQSFNHKYVVTHAVSIIDDYYKGITLIPIGNDVYVECHWNS